MGKCRVRVQLLCQFPLRVEHFSCGKLTHAQNSSTGGSFSVGPLSVAPLRATVVCMRADGVSCDVAVEHNDLLSTGVRSSSSGDGRSMHRTMLMSFCFQSRVQQFSLLRRNYVLRDAVKALMLLISARSPFFYRYSKSSQYFGNAEVEKGTFIRNIRLADAHSRRNMDEFMASLLCKYRPARELLMALCKPYVNACV